MLELAEPSGQMAVSNFVPISSLVLRRSPAWQPVVALTELRIAALRGIDVGDVRVLLARVSADEVSAYLNECPGTPFPLDAAPIQDGLIICPWHGCRFEVRGGRRVDDRAPGLGVLPARIVDGQVVIAVPQAAAA